LVVASVAACGLLAPHADAQERPPLIWYRSSDGCPDGAAFVARLRGAAAGAKLAGAGDRIDFVVTLGTTGGESSGRLERQTQSGTVAVREIAAPSCEEIADVLALTLTLALEPPPAAPSDAPPSAKARTEAPLAAESQGHDAPARTRDGGVTAIADRDGPGTASAAPDSRSAWSIGAQGGVLTRVVPALAPLGAAFVEFEHGLPVFRRAALRLSVLGAVSESADEQALQMAILAGRFEVCPVELGSRVLRAQPCLGIETGGVRAGYAEASERDTGAWAAFIGHARVVWALGPSFALEGQVGGIAPLIRYALRTRVAGDDLYRSEPVGLSAAAGVVFRLP
jgi:hypothetical protein